MNAQIILEDIEAFCKNFPHYEAFKGKTILITGCTGLLGSLTVKCLHRLSILHDLYLHIICPVRNIEKAKHIFPYEKIEFTSWNAERPEVLPCSPSIDYILHFASPTSSAYFVSNPVGTFQSIVDGTISMLEIARKNPSCSMLFASSLEVYGTVTEQHDSIPEAFQGYLDPLSTRSSYPMGKRAAECLCHSYAQQYGSRILIARLTQTVGPGLTKNDTRAFAQFCRAAALHQDIILHTEGKPARPYCYTMDAINAMLTILLKGKSGEAYNVANASTYISAIELANYIQKQFTPDIQVRIELEDGYGYPPTTYLPLDTTKIQSLGWQPSTNLYQMVENTIKSYR